MKGIGSALGVLTLRGAVNLSLALACGIGAAHAAPLYGVISIGDITSGNGDAVGISTFLTQRWDTGQGLYQMVTSYASPVLSASGSYTVGASTVTGSAMSWASSEGESLHGYAAATLSGVCETCAFETENGGLFEVQWADTIYVDGLPSGTPVNLMFTDVLHSSTIGPSGTTTLTSVLSLGAQSIELINNNGSTDGLVTQSVTIQTVSGATLQLTSALAGEVNVPEDVANRFGGTISAAIDASDTAFSYITVLTPGASYTTASGISYESPAPIPEPRSLWMVASAFAALWGAMGPRWMNRS